MRPLFTAVTDVIDCNAARLDTSNGATSVELLNGVEAAAVVVAEPPRGGDDSCCFWDRWRSCGLRGLDANLDGCMLEGGPGLSSRVGVYVLVYGALQ